MRICLVSDTHEHHSVDASKFWLPKCDLLVHAGDFTMLGEPEHVEAFNQWIIDLKQLGRIKHAIVICGNHELNADSEKSLPAEVAQFFDILTEPEVLNNTETEYGGYKFYGSPQTPWFHNWAFNVQRGAAIKEYWDMIPDDTDILITHGPPKWIGDQANPRWSTDHVGCEDLYDAVKRVKPQIHVFGHLHGGYGLTQSVSLPGTLFVNASICNEAYKPVNAPVVIDLL